MNSVAQVLVRLACSHIGRTFFSSCPSGFKATKLAPKARLQIPQEGSPVADVLATASAANGCAWPHGPSDPDAPRPTRVASDQGRVTRPRHGGPPRRVSTRAELLTRGTRALIRQKQPDDFPDPTDRRKLCIERCRYQAPVCAQLPASALQKNAREERGNAQHAERAPGEGAFAGCHSAQPPADS